MKTVENRNTKHITPMSLAWKIILHSLMGKCSFIQEFVECSSNAKDRGVRRWSIVLGPRKVDY